jgi:glycosyltransferase involved in cell wall biosynthesis
MEPYLSIIIPAYNEAERILPTLQDINQKMQAVSYPYEIVVINDGSTDTTAQVVRLAQSSIPNLKLIDNIQNKGKGGVVRQGMLESKGAVRLFMDADNSTTVDQFEMMRPWFEKGYDVVIGSRAVKGAKLEPPQPFYKQLLGKASNIIIQLVNVPGIWDTQCGFKAFSQKAAEDVFAYSKIPGWGFDIEILALSRALQYRIKEVPVRWVNDIRSHVRLSAYLKVFVENLTIRWWLWTNMYHIKK